MKSLRLLLALLTGMAVLTGAYAAEHPSALIPFYEKVSAALAADDFAEAKPAARQLAVEAARLRRDPIAAAAHAVAGAADLAAAREAFKTLSLETIALARNEKGYFIINCPMANADWVQSTREIANPYLGSAMFSCGTVKEETKG
jgi:Cu(I)/Ag(I) efflux system membrane fusion protein